MSCYCAERKENNKEKEFARTQLNVVFVDVKLLSRVLSVS